MMAHPKRLFEGRVSGRIAPFKIENAAGPAAHCRPFSIRGMHRAVNVRSQANALELTNFNPETKMQKPVMIARFVIAAAFFVASAAPAFASCCP
jgi:hypothetical protein